MFTRWAQRVGLPIHTPGGSDTPARHVGVQPPADGPGPGPGPGPGSQRANGRVAAPRQELNHLLGDAPTAATHVADLAHNQSVANHVAIQNLGLIPVWDAIEARLGGPRPLATPPRGAGQFASHPFNWRVKVDSRAHANGIQQHGGAQRLAGFLQLPRELVRRLAPAVPAPQTYVILAGRWVPEQEALAIPEVRDFFRRPQVATRPAPGPAVQAPPGRVAPNPWRPPAGLHPQARPAQIPWPPARIQQVPPAGYGAIPRPTMPQVHWAPSRPTDGAWGGVPPGRPGVAPRPHPMPVRPRPLPQVAPGRPGAQVFRPHAGAAWHPWPQRPSWTPPRDAAWPQAVPAAGTQPGRPNFGRVATAWPNRATWIAPAAGSWAHSGWPAPSHRE